MSAWLCRPTAAATASLTAVLCFTALLGIVFLPKEARRLATPYYVSVTHFLSPQADRPGVTLFWSIPLSGAPGWHHHLAVEPPTGPQVVRSFAPSTMQPLSLASGADSDHVLVGNWDGSIYSLDLRQPDNKPDRIGCQSDGGVIALASSPDGKYVLSQNAFHLYGWDVASKRQAWRRDDLLDLLCRAARCPHRDRGQPVWRPRRIGFDRRSHAANTGITEVHRLCDHT